MLAVRRPSGRRAWHTPGGALVDAGRSLRGRTMTQYRYPFQALLADYGRAGVGLLATGGPLLFVPPNPAIIAVLGGLAGLFLVFGLRTGVRQMTTVEITEQGISVSGLRSMSLEWQSIRDVRLRYYST